MPSMIALSRQCSTAEQFFVPRFEHGSVLDMALKPASCFVVKLSGGLHQASIIQNCKIVQMNSKGTRLPHGVYSESSQMPITKESPKLIQ